MKFRRWITAAALALVTGSAWAVTYLGSDAIFHAVAFADLPNITANSVFGNATNAAATGTSVSVPACSTALIYTNGTGFGCAAGSGSSSPSAALFIASQTVTIPTGMTKAYIKLWGGSGGSGGHDANANEEVFAGGAGGYLEKFLSGLTAGNTLAFTAGSAGAAGTSTPTAGGNGTASSLASGTQVISTLTANGGNGSGASSGGIAGSVAVGGTATGGDLNYQGLPISSTNGTGALNAIPNFYAQAGTGSFGVATASAGIAGNAGGMIILWYPFLLRRDLKGDNDNTPAFVDQAA